MTEPIDCKTDPEKTQINVKLPTRQKAEWERNVAQSVEYGSVSKLIRIAVEHELSDAGTDASAAEPAGVPDGVQDALDALRSDVSDVQRRVEAMHDASGAGPAGSDLKAEIWAALADADGGLTPEAVADRIGGPVEARDALQALADMQADGHVTTDDGTTFRRDQ